MSDPILDLLAAPPSPALSVDERAVYAGGRRRLRRRTLRRTGMGVVGVVGAAAIAFGALGAGVNNDALPAGPSPSASSSGRVSAELLDGRYAVEVVPGAPADQPNVIFYAIKDGKRSQLAGSSATSNVISLGTGSGADGVMLGTAPAGATEITTATTAASGGWATDYAPLPGTGFQAVAVKFDKPADVDRYLTTYWLDEGGQVRSAQGATLPSALVPGTKERLFVDRENRQLGSLKPGGGSLTPLIADPVLGTGEKSDTDGWTWRTTVLLPRGAHDVTFNWDTGSTPGKVDLLALDGTSILATGTATAPASSSSPVLRSVDYTDAVSEPRHQVTMFAG